MGQTGENHESQRCREVQRNCTRGKVLGLANRVDLVLILNPPCSTGNVALGKLLPSLHVAFLVCIWCYMSKFCSEIYKEITQCDAGQTVGVQWMVGGIWFSFRRVSSLEQPLLESHLHPLELMAFHRRTFATNTHNSLPVTLLAPEACLALTRWQGEGVWRIYSSASSPCRRHGFCATSQCPWW